MSNSNTTSMSKEILTGKNSLTRIDNIPRYLPTVSQKIQPADSKDEILSPTHSNVVFLDSLPSMPMKQNTTILPDARSTDNHFYKSKTEEFSVPHMHESPSVSNENFSNLKEIKEADHGFSKWYNDLSPTKQIILKVIIATLITLAAVSAVALPLYYFVFLSNQSESSFTNITTSACSGTTCIGQETPYRSSIVTTFFPFDGNTNDQTGYVTGTLLGATGPSYTVGYLTQAINFNLNPPQYVQILNLNLAQQSFTVQLWVYVPAFTLSNDFGIFGQCDAYNVCISLSVRFARFTFSLNSMNIYNYTLTGSTIVSGSSFYHVTIVYDSTQFQQLIYVNGQIDAVSNGIVNPYQGNSASLITTIGRSTSSPYPNSYFYGRIDQFTISAGYVRSACEILNDASLVVYYPFSTTGTLNDYSVNLCNGIASGTTTVSAGRVGQAISFVSNTSYFQSDCFPRTRPNYPAFSVSLWINPTSITGGGSLVHISSLSNGNGTCYDLLGLTSSGVIVAQWLISPTASLNSTSGPIIPANAWTHIAVVYQSANGVRLYINGQYSSASSNTAGLTVYEIGGGPSQWYMTLGNISPTGSSTPVNCPSGSPAVASGAFLGAIDEFRLYNRDLNTEELCVLANP